MPGQTWANLLAHIETDGPLAEDVLERLTVGRQPLTEFIHERYLQQFIPLGGGKVKLVHGPPGRGKSHFLGEIGRLAGQFGYVVSYIDARATRVDEFHALYRAVAGALQPREMLRGLYREVLAEKGWLDEVADADEAIVDRWRSEGTENLYLRELKRAIETLFLDKRLNRSFATAIAQGVAHVSGMQRLSETEWSTLQRWLQGDPLPKRETKPLRIFQRVDRFSGRDMLRSWAVLATSHLDKKGIVILLDNLETLVTGSGVGYTKQRRDQAYENVRQLIDDVDQATHVFLLIGAGDELIRDGKKGIRTYPALWQRLQDEIETGPNHPNHFADVIALDRYPLDADELRELARRLVETWQEETGGSPPSAAMISRRVNEAQAGAGQFAAPGNLVRALVRDLEGRRP